MHVGASGGVGSRSGSKGDIVGSHGKEMVQVHGPAFSMFGESTEAKLFKALTKSEIANGFVNRMLLWNAGRGALPS
jgi:hypothetical protein